MEEWATCRREAQGKDMETSAHLNVVHLQPGNTEVATAFLTNHWKAPELLSSIRECTRQTTER